MDHAADKWWLFLYGISCVRAICFAMAALRVGAIFPQWNAACKEVLGRSWWALALDRSKSGAAGTGAAHPGKMFIFLVPVFFQGLFGFAIWFTGEAPILVDKWASLAGGALAMEITDQVFFLALFSILPSWFLCSASRDKTSPIGAALATRLEIKNGPQEALAQRAAIEEALPPPPVLSRPAPRL